MAEPDALARALDQAGHVGDGELAAVGRLDRAEHGRERRERIVGDLRARVRDPREQRRLARVRQADERGVGEQLQAQLDLALLAGQADLGEARRLPRRRRRSACCRGRRLPPRATTTRAPGWARSATSRSSAIEHLRADGDVQGRRPRRGLRARDGRRRRRRARRAASGSGGRRRGRAGALPRRARRRRRRRRRRRPARPSARTSRAGSGATPSPPRPA